MNLNFLRPAFAFLWLAVGLAIVLRNPLGIGFFNDRWSDEDLLFGSIVAFALALWNGMRWWAGRRGTRPAALPPNPLQPRDRDRPFEYNPELDFTKPK
jgi:hypothetical protein